MDKFWMAVLQVFIWDKAKRRAFREKYKKYTLNNGNEIVLFDDAGNNVSASSIIPNLNIIFSPTSSNNKLYIHKDNLKIFTNSYINFDCNNATIKIDKTNYIHDFCVWCCCGDNQSLYWGRNSNVFGCTIHLNEEKASLYVGEDCMFSVCISIWGTDGHAIMDKTSRKILNFIEEPIYIGDHCWIGEGVRILKNTKIPNGSVVGAGSLVTKKYEEENVILAGNPARIIKRNIVWDRRTPTLCQNPIKPTS